MKKQKGITLIALIITIIVMLLLVGVSVTVALNGGLFNTAQKVKADTEVEKDKELAIAEGTEQLKYYVAKSKGETTAETYEEYAYGYWKPTEEFKFANSKKEREIEIGQKVDYNAGVEGYNGEWIILGAENEKVLLMSTQSVGSLFEREAWPGDFEKRVGKLESKLKAACIDFDKGEFAVKDSARGLKIEDIDNLTGYIKTEYNSGKINQYGNKVTYTLIQNDSVDTVISWTVEGKENLNGTYSLRYGNMGFKTPTKELSVGESYEVEFNDYSYDIKNYTIPASIKRVLDR